ncbi:MAG: four helix bundle protein [Mariprofundaceae bacterium]
MSAIIKSHRDLDVWKRAISLARDVYTVTQTYPKEEIYGLVGQMRRASVSIASNIAEGAARKGAREFLRFLSIAAGSASELDTQIEISKQIGLANERDLNALQTATVDVTKMIFGLIRSVKQKL